MRSSYFLAGCILGSIVSQSWVMGHARNWNDGGPILGLLLGGVTLCAMFGIAMAEDDDERG